MTNKTLILDKDGTITTPASGKRFVQHPEDQVLIPGVTEAIDRYIAEGYTIAIATNQGGVAAGHKTIDDARKEVEYCMGLLDGRVAMAALCPDDGETCHAIHKGEWHIHSAEDKTCASFRKPGCGMLELMEQGGHLIFVGDRDEDQAAAAAMGTGMIGGSVCKFIWAKDFLKPPKPTFDVAWVDDAMQVNEGA